MPRRERSTTDGSKFTIRRGTSADAPALIAMFDESIAWMVERDLTEQWGTTPFSRVPKRVAMCEQWAAGGGMHVAEREGLPAAAIVLGDAHPYVPPAETDEIYIQVLIGSRQAEARGAGAALLTYAKGVADRRSVPLRVDCFAGNNGRLIAFYQSGGFTPTETFRVGEWPGQLLIRQPHED